MYSYISFIVSQTNSTANYSSIYLNILNRDSILNIWKFYFNLVNKESGLYNSNFYKSLLLNLVNGNDNNLLKPKQTMVINYMSTFRAYHFSITSQTYKKLFFMFSSAVPSNYYSYNINLDTYNNYIWLSWYYKTNPLNNAFYFKIYNY